MSGYKLSYSSCYIHSSCEIEVDARWLKFDSYYAIIHYENSSSQAYKLFYISISDSATIFSHDSWASVFSTSLFAVNLQFNPEMANGIFFARKW